MKRLLIGTMLLALIFVVPVPAMAAVDISIGISLPPPIVFQAPPAVIVLPDANDVYVVPDIDVDMYFWNGWWWRPWQGRFNGKYDKRITGVDDTTLEILMSHAWPGNVRQAPR